jgi:hypothetical protein
MPRRATSEDRAGDPDASRVVSPEHVLQAARDMFLRHATVDMPELAARLAVSRATLYRVASSREHLLADVIWSLAMASLRSAVRQTTGQMDVDRVLEIGARFRQMALGSEPLREFVLAERSTAAAVLHTPSPMRDALIDAWNDLLMQATAERRSSLSIVPQHAAEIVVSLGASTI